MRITSGIYKNRKISVPDGDKIRPTSDRMRQSLFNILNHATWLDEFTLKDTIAMDIFCGSGALGIEALSNGARHVVFIDKDVATVKENTYFLNNDDFQIKKRNMPNIGLIDKKINLVFMDPPYHMDLVKPTISNLIQQQCLADNAIIIVETEKGLVIESDLELLDKRSQSKSDLHILRYNSAI